MAKTCVFCQIVAGEAPATVVYEWGDAIAFLPREDEQGQRGCTPGHILVVPRVHVADAATAPIVTGVVAGRAAEYASRIDEPFNLITSAGEEATQSVFHLHWHIVPRRPGDGLLLPWSGQRGGSDE